MTDRFDPITLGILWDQLISITDQTMTTLVQTSFSTIVRESYDLSCLVFDANGQSLAQGSWSDPSFIGTAPQTIRHMLDKFPPATLQPGDVIVTNDPWLGTGHLFDINVMRPVFRGARLVGYTFSITHLPDIGGIGWSATATEVYDEGLWLPVCKLFKAGTLNEELMDLIRINVRTPEMTIGDLMANVSSTHVGARLLIEFMDEYGLDDLAPLSQAIIDRSENAMREKIKEMPDGVYEHELLADSAVGELVPIRCRVSICGDRIHIDYDGTGPAIRAGVNVPFCYTKSFSLYGIKCLTIPSIPNNEGSMRPITVSAPAGCILNAQPPSPTGARQTIGHFAPIVIFGALAKALADVVPAQSGMVTTAPCHGTRRNGRPLATVFFGTGGLGAFNHADGRATMPAPANRRKTPNEVWEDFTDMTVVEEELRCDSGGPGTYCGGLGSKIVMRNESGHGMTFDFLGARSRIAAEGTNGGKPGALRQLLINGEKAEFGTRIQIEPGDEITVLDAGGGGHGDPRDRPLEKVLEDVSNGFVSVEGALRDYGVKVDPRTLTAERV